MNDAEHWFSTLRGPEADPDLQPGEGEIGHGVWRRSPNGVQRQASVQGSKGRSPSEADDILLFERRISEQT